MASKIDLYQRDDFAELIQAAAEHHAIGNPAIVEKDYFVSEALRIIAKSPEEPVIFKGGTSLSKGWSLIKRFSEDIDLFVHPGARGPSARDSLLKRLSKAVAGQHGLSLDPNQGATIGGLARTVYYTYGSRFVGGAIEPSIILEAGIQSGTFPVEDRPIDSILVAFLRTQGAELDSERTDPFTLPVLHFRRTFVEKLFALHDKVSRGWLKHGTPIGSYARHYYDVSQLIPTTEVTAMLNSSEYGEIVHDYREKTSKWFPKQEFPDRLDLSTSDALYPAGELRDDLRKHYDEQCRALCYGEYPPFDDVLTTLESIRAKLSIE